MQSVVIILVCVTFTSGTTDECKNDVRFVFTPICVVGGSWFIYLVYDFHIRWCSCRLTVTGITRWAGTANVSGTPMFILCFSEFRVTRSFSFLGCVLQIVACHFVILLLAIVLSVLLRFTGSDYPFGIFKLFLPNQGYEELVTSWY